MARIAGWRNAATAQVRTVAVSAFVGEGFFQAGLVHGMASFYGVTNRHKAILGPYPTMTGEA